MSHLHCYQFDTLVIWIMIWMLHFEVLFQLLDFLLADVAMKESVGPVRVCLAVELLMFFHLFLI